MPSSSASVRIVVSGVRISWSRLAANWRSRSTISSTRSRKRWNVSVSTPASSVCAAVSHGGRAPSAQSCASQRRSGRRRAPPRRARSRPSPGDAHEPEREHREAEAMDALLGRGRVEDDGQPAVLGVGDGDVERLAVGVEVVEARREPRASYRALLVAGARRARARPEPDRIEQLAGRRQPGLRRCGSRSAAPRAAASCRRDRLPARASPRRRGSTAGRRRSATVAVTANTTRSASERRASSAASRGARDQAQADAVHRLDAVEAVLGERLPERMDLAAQGVGLRLALRARAPPRSRRGGPAGRACSAAARAARRLRRQPHGVAGDAHLAAARGRARPCSKRSTGSTTLPPATRLSSARTRAPTSARANGLVR